jgi:hypothetical protein
LGYVLTYEQKFFDTLFTGRFMTGSPQQLPYSDTNSGLHYDLRLDIDPGSRSIFVSGSIAYHSPIHRLERARFYLHRQFVLNRVEGRRVLGYQFSSPQETAEGTGFLSGEQPVYHSHASFTPQASVLDIYFDPPLRKNETTIIQLEYHGNINVWPAESTSIITNDWVELGASLPWFPTQFDSGFSDLTFTLKINTPASFLAASYGRPATLNGEWYFEWPHPTKDIIAVAGSSLQSYSFESDTNRVYLSTSTFDQSAANQLGEDLLWLLERFSGWFGPVRPSEITLIESPRKLGGDYAQRGLIVISGTNQQDYLEQREVFLHRLAHETAHAWWWEAAIGEWEDWLNESFAEYSALLAIRERFGVDSFHRLLSAKRERANGTQPLWEFQRGDVSSPEKQTQVERLLLDTGPLILDELSQRIGPARFLELCRARIWSGVMTTQHLLDLLEELEDKSTRQWLEEQIRG